MTDTTRRRWRFAALALAVLIGAVGLGWASGQLRRARPAVAAAALLRGAGFTPAEVPHPAPPLQVCDTTTGKVVSLAELRGRPVLVKFWGTSCAPCLKDFPALERLADHHQGLAVLCVCANESDAEEAERIARPHAGTLPVFVDPRGLAALRYEVQVLPTAIWIDPAGQVLGRATGVVDWSAPEVEALLAAYESR